MTEPANPLPPDYFPPDLGYQSQAPHADAVKKLNLVRIFTWVCIGLDVIQVFLCAGMAIFFIFIPTPPPDPSQPPMWVMSILYGAISFFALLCAILKLVCVLKFRNLTPAGRKWMTTAGIVGCCQFLCASCCWLQVAAGIYTLVVINTEPVRAYFASFPQENPPTA